jgi:glycosyltransferase involved in cell wall biosynthesis
VKILFCSYRFHPDIGGIEVNSEVLATEFAKAGHAIRLVTLTKAESERSFPFEIIRCPGIRQLMQLHRWADVVYQNNISLRLLWPSWLLRKPRSISIRTWIRRPSGSMAPVDIIKMMALGTARRISISKAVADSLWFDSVVIGNPYRDSVFYEVPGIKRDRDLCFLGRLVSDKGVDLVLKAIHEIGNKAGRSPSLTIIGTGPEKDDLLAEVNKLGLLEFVTFTGNLEGESLRRTLNQHKILVVPSRWAEPYGNVALEGAACGCIVVASNAGGLPDAVGPSGYVFRSGSVRDLANVLQGCLENSDQILRQVETPRERHLADRQPAAVAASYLSVIIRS